MAVSKRKSTSITAEAPVKKVKTPKEAKAAPAAPKKTLFGKVIGEDEDAQDDEDEGELEAEPIRDDDEQNSMDVDTNASADQTPQRPKIRTLSRFSFVDLTLFCCACLLTIVRMLSFLYIVISPYISNIFNIILCNENNNSHEGAERTKEGPP